jgi:hypothetical protein
MTTPGKFTVFKRDPMGSLEISLYFTGMGWDQKDPVVIIKKSYNTFTKLVQHLKQLLIIINNILFVCQQRTIAHQ